MDSYYYDTGAAGFLVLMVLLSLLFAVAGYVLSSLFLMKIFEKAGVEGKWRAWVPIYNSMIFLKLGDMSPWLILYGIGASVLLGWIPVIGQIVIIATSVLMVLAAYRVGQKLQKEGAWVVLYIFLAIVWLGINAFDKSRWNTQVPPAPWASNAFFGDRTQWVAVPAQSSGQVPPAYGAAPGYGAAPYGAAPGYQPPAAQGYQPPAPGYQQPAAPGYQPPAAPGYQPQPSAPPTDAPVVPPVTPPPADPPVPPTTPPAPPIPPAPPAEPTQPPTR